MNQNIASTYAALEMGTRRYLSELRRIKWLDQGEEHMLAERFRRHNDVLALHKLVTSHIQLVVKVAVGYRGYGLPMGEVISEGSIGLVRAVTHFDPDSGFRLTSYAIWWIRSAINDYVFRSWSLVKIGSTANHRKLFFSLRKTKRVISAFEEGDMSYGHVKAIATRLGVTERDVIFMNRRMARDASLNVPAADNGREWQDALPDERPTQEAILIEREEKAIRMDALHKALKVLNIREKRVLEARRLFDQSVTVEELAAELGVSQQRVYQIELQAFKKVQCVVTREVASKHRRRVRRKPSTSRPDFEQPMFDSASQRERRKELQVF